MEESARIPVSVPDLRGNETAYLERCVATNWISSAGSFVNDFEKAIADYVGAAHGVAMVNGTCALEMALRLAGVGPGDVVLVPDWTFVATANAVCHIGAKPHFVDIEPESWGIDASLIDKAVAEADGRVAAIVPVHALGHPADLDPILAAAKAHDLPVVEDAAGAIGARYKGRRIGSGTAPAAILSFNGNKLLTAGSGGMIVTDDATLAERARFLSAQARKGDAYRYEEIAFNYRLSNVNAAIGLAQFERLEEMLAARRGIAGVYRDKLQGSTRMSLPPLQPWAETNGWLSAVCCRDAESARRLIVDMVWAGIDARPFWESLSDQPAFDGFGHTLTGVAEGLTGRVVTLPSSSNLAEADLARVLAVLDRWA